jgi:hypothetical protein
MHTFFKSSVEMITDSKLLVSEPQNLESGPGGGSKTSEIYYTPTESLNTTPISPPNIKHGQSYFPSPLKLEENEPGTSQVLLSDANNNVNSKPSERFYTPTDIVTTNPITESRDVIDEQIDQESDNINHETFPSIDENSETNNNNKPPCIRFSESTATTKPSTTIIKQDPMLVKINFEEGSEVHVAEYLKNPFNEFSNWKELLVRLKPGKIELCESKVKKIIFLRSAFFFFFIKKDNILIRYKNMLFIRTK